MFFKATATPEIYPSGHHLSLHDALPLGSGGRRGDGDRLPQGAAERRRSQGAVRARGHDAARGAAYHRDRRKGAVARRRRSEEHTSERQSLMRISYAGFSLDITMKLLFYVTTLEHK